MIFPSTFICFTVSLVNLHTLPSSSELSHLPLLPWKKQKAVLWISSLYSLLAFQTLLQVLAFEDYVIFLSSRTFTNIYFLPSSSDIQVPAECKLSGP